MENLIFLRPSIYGIIFTNDGFYVSNDKTEGKFLIYKKDNKIKLYGLLWTNKIIESDYNFDIERINYNDLIRWIHRARCQYQFNDIHFNKTFDINEEMIGGGFLSKNLEKMLWVTYHDEKIKKVELDIIKKCLETKKPFKVETVDKIKIIR